MKKLLKLLGLVKQSDFDELARALRSRVLEVDELKMKNLKLDLSVKNTLPYPVIRVDEDDPDMISGPARKSYVAMVAAFGHDIMEKKLRRMISEVRADVMSIGRETYGYSQQDFDIYLKGTENSLQLLRDWFELMISEHIANNVGEDELTEEDKKELKDKLL